MDTALRLEVFTKAFIKMSCVNYNLWDMASLDLVKHRCKMFWDGLDSQGLNALQKHPAKAGHDFFLSSQGIGGFYDRDPLDYDNALIEADLMRADIIAAALAPLTITDVTVTLKGN